MSNPVFVLLHGAWHTARSWDKLVSELTIYGSSPPTPDWSADVELIHRIVSELVEEGRDVVIVMHSFSGMTGGTALDKLDKPLRMAKILSGGVVRLVYIVAFLVLEGLQHSPRGTRDNMVGIITFLPEDVKEMLYQDMDDQTVAELAKDLQPQSFAAFWSTTTHATWRHIPTTYVLCLKNKPNTMMAAQYLVDSTKASGPHKIDNLIKVNAGHSPFISRPEWTANMLIDEAKRSV
ncbi:alpha/beta-hydrolase [Bimuria novae-zelandiae CBS 107.79]|uniref:Alpha/beta-hydrolase n=1 Tax=Bimuria novae-zelandiae CBS 107.79 TaxID=1447943 RepID=A0A6A5VMH3_9PLEO|nr:alpha/beta-hydrolase [Bimuria novae-zelandiae CBS 107.79]